MRRYRAAIFKYAILINVALALFVLWRSFLAILDYEESLIRWATTVPATGPDVYTFDGPVQPHPSLLFFAWIIVFAALALMLTSIVSLVRGRRWDYWLRIFSFLAILLAIWFGTLEILAYFIDEGWGQMIFKRWSTIYPLLISLLATLWLAYNISYRPAAPDAGAPSR